MEIVYIGSLYSVVRYSFFKESTNFGKELRYVGLTTIGDIGI